MVGPYGAILELSAAALDFGELDRDCTKFNDEFGPELRAWQERCGKIRGFIPLLSTVFKMGLKLSLNSP